MWFQKYFKMDKAGEGSGGGAAGGGDDAAKAAKELADIKAERDSMKAELEKFKASRSSADDDLQKKAAAVKADAEKRAADERKLEGALKFTIGAKDWLKTNASLLPQGIAGIFDAAEKENFSGAIEKDAAIKVGIIKEFFSLQENLDHLTGSQKLAVENFKKLTKTDQQERAGEIYDSIFEPAFEMLKKIKRAEQMSKGLAPDTDQHAAYKKKLIEGSRKHFLGETK